MKKARNILLIITILGYIVFIHIIFNPENNYWSQSKEINASKTVNWSPDSLNQKSDIESEKVIVKLNKGMDPTPIPNFPPKIVSSERTVKRIDDHHEFLAAD